jgi:hypothetical protein
MYLNPKFSWDSCIPNSKKILLLEDQNEMEEELINKDIIMKFLMQFVIVSILDEVLNLVWILLQPFLRLCMIWAILRGAEYFMFAKS